MEQVSMEGGVAEALTSLLSDRLAVLAGAGLSMAPPSLLPSAATLAARAKATYDAIYVPPRAPLAISIEDQAEFFFAKGQLGTVYLQTLIDRDAFAGPPNEGHYAIADLLLVRALQTVATTNIDFLVETAGLQLFGHVGSGIDGNAVSALPPDTAPYLKIHGCRLIDLVNTIWAPSQITCEPVASRIRNSAQ